jgi:hypothetical protein
MGTPIDDIAPATPVLTGYDRSTRSRSCACSTPRLTALTKRTSPASFCVSTPRASPSVRTTPGEPCRLRLLADGARLPAPRSRRLPHCAHARAPRLHRARPRLEFRFAFSDADRPGRATTLTCAAAGKAQTLTDRKDAGMTRNSAHVRL